MLYARHALAIGLAVAALSGAAETAHANLIQNGGFETGTFSSWTVSGNVFMSGVPIYGAYGNTSLDGNYAIVFNAGDSAPNAILSQSFATVAGTDYGVSFLYGGTAGQSVTVSAKDNNSLLLGSAFATANGTFSASTLFTYNFRADSALSTLTIADYTGNYTYSSDGFLDNASVSAVPEPTSIILFATGLAGLASIRRRKRN